jgi:hypothetical protein
LVREICIAHGWTVSCGETSGGGASFSVRWDTIPESEEVRERLFPDWDLESGEQRQPTGG